MKEFAEHFFNKKRAPVVQMSTACTVRTKREVQQQCNDSIIAVNYKTEVCSLISTIKYFSDLFSQLNVSKEDLNVD